MKPVNVLITAASRRVGLVRAFRSAVERFGNGTVVTTDINSMSPALYFGHRNHIVPLTTDPEYIPIIESICDVENIHLIIPTIDDELPVFGRNRGRFERTDVWVAVSGEETAELSNDKYRMHEFALANGIESPTTRLPQDIKFEEIAYPVVVKPRNGRGSIQVFEAHNEEQLRFFCSYVPDAIVQDYLEGQEFTVDVCSDFEARVMSVVPRERLVIRAGVSDKGTTRNHKRVIEFAINVAESLQIIGAANIQCKWDGRTVKLIEVNPRFSGGHSSDDSCRRGLPCVARSIERRSSCSTADWSIPGRSDDDEFRGELVCERGGAKDSPESRPSPKVRTHAVRDGLCQLANGAPP